MADYFTAYTVAHQPRRLRLPAAEIPTGAAPHPAPSHVYLGIDWPNTYTTLPPSEAWFDEILFDKAGTTGENSLFGGSLFKLLGGGKSAVTIPSAMSSAVATANITAAVVNVNGGSVLCG